MQIKAPDLGVDEAEVSEILVKVGDTVEKEESLLVLESAKASVEVPSPASGTIKTIVIKTGQTVTQGDVLFELENADDVSHSDGQSDVVPTDSKSDAAPTPPDSALEQPESKPSVPENTTSDSAQKATETDIAQPSLKEVTVPDLGVDEAEVSEILVKVGDVVEKEQSLLVLESAKASVEVPSPFAGLIKEIKLSAGQKVTQGALILTIEMSAPSESGEDNVHAESSKSDSKKPDSNKLASEKMQTEKAQEEKLQVENQSSASKSKAEVDKSSDQAEGNVNSGQSASLSQDEINANSKVYAGPAVRQLARQLGVALANVSASGANQRIVKEDVLAFVKQHLEAQQSAPANQNNAPMMSGLPTLPDFEKFGGGEVAAMTRLQQVSVPQLSLNNFIPQVTQFDLADITELENWRNTLKADYKKQNISLTILAFIIKALAYLLKQEPYFNSHLSDDQKSVLIRHEIHIGIAVATDDGLTVPVLRHPDTLSIKDIAIQLGELSQKARDKKLKPQDLQGASFTVTSLGSIGGTAFTPLVNWPQVAILGISPASMQPVWNGKKFKPRLMLPLSLSYDHRVINGADAARFSYLFTQLLADIRKILL